MSLNEKKPAIEGTLSSHSGGEEGGHGTKYHGDDQGLEILGYTSELKRNRSMFTLLFQSLAIAAVRSHSFHTSSRLVSLFY